MSRRPREPATSFGRHLRELREAQGLTQKDLAERSGLDQQRVTYYELHATRPTADILALLAKALHVRVEDLLNGKAQSTEKHLKDPKFRRKLLEAEELPAEDKLVLVKMIDLLKHKQPSLVTG